MPLYDYGVLKGRPINKRLGAGSSPHFQVHIIDETTDYRIAVNVKSQLSPSELLYIVDDNFKHPMTHGLSQYELGFTPIDSNPEGIALDFIRGNLFEPSKMVPLAHNIPGPDNDLNEKINHYVERAINDSDAMVYAFGERWGPEENKKDKYFGFKPGNGIHDIHMNQGNVGRFIKDDGVWQDGALLFHFPTQGVWVGVFLAFQSQSWHTDDQTGHAISGGAVADGSIRIVAAKVNPAGPEPGNETVILLNTTADAISLDGWAIVDKNKRKEQLTGPVLEAGSTTTIVLSGKNAQLSNKGGIITLLDANGIKIDGVSYTKEQVKRQGWTWVF